MRIAVIAPPWIPVPPLGYGGIERVLKLLVDELVAQGHEVTLFAAGPCDTEAEVCKFLDEAPTDKMGHTLYDAYHVGQAFREIFRGGFDIVHDHSGFLGPAFAGLLETPLVHTLHGPFLPEIVEFYTAFKDSCFYVAISNNQMMSCPNLNYLGVVHNAVDIEEHRYLGVKEDYLACVSRICEDKGTVNAVRLARGSGMRLVLAGKIDPGRDREYFEKHVFPHVDGDRVIYAGEVSQEEKVRIISRARAFLFPIQWDEPFGLVMAEALACGTPVLATRWGAVPEVVEHGLTGFLADTPEELAPYLKRIDELDPLTCRRRAEERFSPRVMAEGYVELFEQALETSGVSLQSPSRDAALSRRRARRKP
jgi:glycosyltransferase involved in cell wall biosynthesis